MLFVDIIDMESLAPPNILNTKVNNKQAKDNWAPLMVPQARSGGALLVAVLLETFLKENVCQGPRLWETIDTIASFEVNLVIGMYVFH